MKRLGGMFKKHSDDENPKDSKDKKKKKVRRKKDKTMKRGESIHTPANMAEILAKVPTLDDVADWNMGGKDEPKKADGKKSDGKKSDGKKSDKEGKKSDGKKSDGKKSDKEGKEGKKSDGKKPKVKRFGKRKSSPPEPSGEAPESEAEQNTDHTETESEGRKSEADEGDEHNKIKLGEYITISPTLPMKHTYLSRQQLAARLARPKKVAKVNIKTGATPMWGSVKGYCTAPYDQGQEGSCTANALCMAYKVSCRVANNKDADWEPSRAYIYYKERAAEGTASSDSGADVVDGESWAQQRGICSESLWPYDTTKVDDIPPSCCDDDASQHKIAGYATIPIDSNLIAAIESSILDKKPVNIAISVYQSFEGSGPAATGVIPLPGPIQYNNPSDPRDPYMGGHEMCLVGYSRDKQLFTVINSWGSNWGASGYCYIPYGYLSDSRLGLEFTVISV